MIKKIVDFIEKLLVAENLAYDLQRDKSKFEEFNDLVKTSICPYFRDFTLQGVDAIVQWSLVKPMEYSETDDFYEDHIGLPPPVKRRIYKVSTYKTSKYQLATVVCVSCHDPSKDRISDALVVIPDKKLGFSIISKYRFNKKKIEWKFAAGEEFDNFPCIGNLLEIERLKAPKDYDESMIEYWKKM